MNIFDYIENKSNELARMTFPEADEDHIELYDYKIFKLLSHSFDFGTGIVLSLIFGYFFQYLIVLFTFIILRSYAAGYHCDTFKNCYFTTNVLMMVGVLVSKLVLLEPYKIAILILLFGISIIPLCPKPSENSPSRGKEEDRVFRSKYIAYLILLFFVSQALFYFKLFDFGASILGGIFIVAFIVSDFGENSLKNFWLMVDHK